MTKPRTYFTVYTLGTGEKCYLKQTNHNKLYPNWWTVEWMLLPAGAESCDEWWQWPGPVFCLLLRVSSDCAQPITGRPILTGLENGFKIRPNRLPRQQDWTTSQTTHNLSYWIWITIHICTFKLVQNHYKHLIMSLFTQNRQLCGGRKWGTLTDLWVDPVHRISQAMISKIWLQSMWKSFQNNNFIVYQPAFIWNVSKLPLKTSKTFGFDISPDQFALPQVALKCHKHTQTNKPNVTLTLVNLFSMRPNYKK